MEGEKSKNFIKGAVILTVAGLISKFMGFGYRIILTRLIGAEGIGLYEMAYPIYTTLLVVSRSGIPVSLAKLISDKVARGEKKQAFKIFRVGRYLSIIVGIFFSILMALIARPLVNILNWDQRAFYAVLAISPAIFFVSIMATYRGFFQGLQTMVPTAWSQVIEQMVRMITMIGLVYFLVSFSYGKGIAAAGATFGAVSGAIAGLFVLLYIYQKRKSDIWEYIDTDKITNIETLSITKKIASIGLPITFGALVQPLMRLVDTMIVPNRLQVAGFTAEMASELFGQLAGVAIVLVNFPTIITVSLAASLVPSISEAFALKNDNLIKRRTLTALRLTVLIGLPSSVGLFLLASPLTTVIFDVPQAAGILRIVSWGVIFITLQQTTSAIIQGIGHMKVPARNLFLGAVVNAFLNYFLTGIPQIGIKGAAVGTASGFAIAAILNLISLKRITNFNFEFQDLIYKPVLAVMIMGIVVKQGFSLLLNIFTDIFPAFALSLSTFGIVLVAVLIYGFILLLLNEIRYSDLVLIPVIGEFLADNLKKLGLVGDK
ncbi:MAG: putative polysaccharide biosynthesis protein [Halanaerobiales bacterium]